MSVVGDGGDREACPGAFYAADGVIYRYIDRIGAIATIEEDITGTGINQSVRSGEPTSNCYGPGGGAVEYDVVGACSTIGGYQCGVSTRLQEIDREGVAGRVALDVDDAGCCRGGRV